MEILDGEKLAQKVLDKVRNEISGRRLSLAVAVVSVGGGPVSLSYIGKKRAACEGCLIDFRYTNLDVNISQNGLADKIKTLVEDKSINGIVVQLPLPKFINQEEILNLIPPNKDPDMLSDKSFEMFEGGDSKIMPPVLSAIIKLLEEYKIDLSDKKIALVGKGKLVGKPIAAWMARNNFDFTVIDRKEENSAAALPSADVIISGAGSPGLIAAEMVKPGAVLIDAGTSSEDGKVVGDIKKDAYQRASFVAPVPGGVGPLAVACLIENLFKLSEK